MAKYIIETQINTPHYFLIDNFRSPLNFELVDFSFELANKHFDKREGVRYYVQEEVEASNMAKAYHDFMERIHGITDAMAFFYSQPVIVEEWNVLIKKVGDDFAILNTYKPTPTTTSNHDREAISDELLKIVNKTLDDPDIYNIMWLYNNDAQLDGVDHDPASRQLGLCLLVDILADKRQVPVCAKCGRGGHTTTNKKSIDAMLGKDLSNKLYGGSEILRHGLAHGKLIRSEFLDDSQVEDLILKISDQIHSKFGLRNKVKKGQKDRIKGMRKWTGQPWFIQHSDASLEDLLEEYHDNKLSLRSLRSKPVDW